MIVLALLVYAGFYQGATIPAIAFIGATIFDLSMAELLFGDDS